MKYSAHCVDGTVCVVHVQRGACGLWVTALKEVADDCDPVMQCSANARRAQTLMPTAVYILYICHVYKETKPLSMLFCFIKSVRNTRWRCCLELLARWTFYLRRCLKLWPKRIDLFCAILCRNQGLWLSALYWLSSEEVLPN